MSEYFGAVTPFFILALIIGLVEFAKSLGIKDNGSKVLSVVLGAVFAAAFQLSEMYPAAAQWISFAIYSLAFGLAASGLFDLAKRFTPKPTTTNVSGDLVETKTVVSDQPVN